MNRWECSEQKELYLETRRGCPKPLKKHIENPVIEIEDTELQIRDANWYKVSVMKHYGGKLLLQALDSNSSRNGLMIW